MVSLAFGHDTIYKLHIPIIEGLPVVQSAPTRDDLDEEGDGRWEGGREGGRREGGRREGGGEEY